MKSLVLKDLLNIGHNAKSMLFILLVFAIALIPFSGVEGYIFVCAILCSMMIVTTFSFDDNSKCQFPRKNWWAENLLYWLSFALLAAFLDWWLVLSAALSQIKSRLTLWGSGNFYF